MKNLFEHKSGEKMNFGFVIIAAIVIYFAVTMNSAPAAQSGTGAPAPAQTPANTVILVGAPCTQSTTLTSSVVRRYTEAAQTTENVTILQNGILRGTTAHGSTATVQSGVNGDTLDLYPGLQSTTFYSTHLKGKLATCTGATTTGDPQFNVVNDPSVGGAGITYTDTPNHLTQIDTAPTFTIINDDTFTSNTGGQGQGTGANETIGSGGTGSVTVTVRPSGNQVGIGAIGGNILACQYPSTVYDASQGVRAVDALGKDFPASSVVPSSTNYVLIGSNNTVKAWKIPAIDGNQQAIFKMQLILKADNNHNPAGALDRINCTLADTNYYQKQNGGAYVLDIENRDTNVDLGGANTNYDFEVGVA